jgi:AcrR family transcriptional regulator
VGRWQPGVRGRLVEAALTLYRQRGFEQTTVAEIAEQAGVTARTFFRHFVDKREVLFSGSEQLRSAMVSAAVEAPATEYPMDAVAAALDAAGAMLGANRDHSRVRQSVIEATSDLRERELIKMESLSGALAEGLRRRGVGEPDAELMADAGLVAFRVGFRRWLTEPDEDDLTRALRRALNRLHEVTAHPWGSPGRAVLDGADR